MLRIKKGVKPEMVPRLFPDVFPWLDSSWSCGLREGAERPSPGQIARPCEGIQERMLSPREGRRCAGRWVNWESIAAASIEWSLAAFVTLDLFPRLLPRTHSVQMLCNWGRLCVGVCSHCLVQILGSVTLGELLNIGEPQLAPL